MSNQSFYGLHHSLHLSIRYLGLLVMCLNSLANLANSSDTNWGLLSLKITSGMPCWLKTKNTDHHA